MPPYCLSPSPFIERNFTRPPCAEPWPGTKHARLLAGSIGLLRHNCHRRLACEISQVLIYMRRLLRAPLQAPGLALGGEAAGAPGPHLRPESEVPPVTCLFMVILDVSVVYVLCFSKSPRSAVANSIRKSSR